MNKQNFSRINIKQLCFLFLFVAAYNLAFGQQKQDTVIYFFKKDWSTADNIQETTYFMQVLQEKDSIYICRYYNKLGAMIRQESYLDSELTIPNGRFCWYDKNGMLDSSGLVYRKRKTGNWIYYDDDAKPVLLITYYNGSLIEKKDYIKDKDADGTGNSTGLLVTDNVSNDSADKQWKQYLQKTISVPERFIDMTGNGSCQVIVSFTADKEGKTSDIYLKHSCEWSADNEVFKAIMNGTVLKVADERENNVDNSLQDTVIFYSSVGIPYDTAKKKVFVGTQIEAKFSGGAKAWNYFIEKNLNAQVPWENGAPPGEYHVIVSFVVEKDGTVGEVKALNDPGYGTAEEAIRVFKKSPKWIPAIQDGLPVRYRQKQAMTFYVSQN